MASGLGLQNDPDISFKFRARYENELDWTRLKDTLAEHGIPMSALFNSILPALTERVCSQIENNPRRIFNLNLGVIQVQ